MVHIFRFLVFFFLKMIFFGTSIFKYFKSSSNTILRLSLYCLTFSFDIFSSIFIAFRLSTVLGLSETLLKDSPWQFSCHVIPKTSLQALYGGGGRQDEGNPIYFLFTCVPHSSNDKAHGDNRWDQGSCPCLVPATHICEIHQRKGMIVVA